MKTILAMLIMGTAALADEPAPSPTPSPTPSTYLKWGTNTTEALRQYIKDHPPKAD